MSAAAVIRLGPIIGTADLWHPERLERDRWHYRSKALQLPAGGVPLVINHDTEQRIGVVDELFEQRDEEGLSVFARAVVFDRAQHWVRRGTKASICFEEEDAIDLANGGRLFMRGNVLEVTLTKGHPARERTAMVVSTSPIKKTWTPVAAPPRTATPPPRAQTRREQERDELRRRQANWRAELERRYDAAIAAAAGGVVDFGAILRGLQHELGVAQIRPIDLAYEQYKQGQLA